MCCMCWLVCTSGKTKGPPREAPTHPAGCPSNLWWWENASPVGQHIWTQHWLPPKQQPHTYPWTRKKPKSSDVDIHFSTGEPKFFPWTVWLHSQLSAGTTLAHPICFISRISIKIFTIFRGTFCYKRNLPSMSLMGNQGLRQSMKFTGLLVPLWMWKSPERTEFLCQDELRC